ncbi:hypothetical protein [Aeromonas veronii]|uniref:hypothetical protein n=1 Tax=Aeromonas veronii TaxID=654 RepID=UPI00111835BA|nr:hypothetical protein [Aeromonas veronii]
MLLIPSGSFKHINKALYIACLSGLLAGCAASNAGKGEQQKNDGEYLECMKNATASWDPASGEDLVVKINKECK